VSFPEVTYVDAYTFASCTNLHSITLNKCQSISYSAFYNCPNLEYLSLPNCKFISGPLANNAISNLSLPALESINGYALCERMSSLTTLTLNLSHLTGTILALGCS